MKKSEISIEKKIQKTERIINIIAFSFGTIVISMIFILLFVYLIS